MLRPRYALHVVVYDIEDEGVRRRVAAVLEGFGRRVQESVFECRADEKSLYELTARLRKELKRPDNGQIRFYRVCGNCLQASFGLGHIAPPDYKDCYIV
jgi:CRISPR-associated protein Cas2